MYFWIRPLPVAELHPRRKKYLLCEILGPRNWMYVSSQVNIDLINFVSRLPPATMCVAILNVRRVATTPMSEPLWTWIGFSHYPNNTLFTFFPSHCFLAVLVARVAVGREPLSLIAIWSKVLYDFYVRKFSIAIQNLAVSPTIEANMVL